jgi:hypothetical protein
MTVETLLLNKLKGTQASYALDALKAPGNKQEFDFGYRCGFISGLESAIATLLALYEEEEHGDKDL